MNILFELLELVAEILCGIDTIKDLKRKKKRK